MGLKIDHLDPCCLSLECRYYYYTLRDIIPCLLLSLLLLDQIIYFFFINNLQIPFWYCKNYLGRMLVGQFLLHFSKFGVELYSIFSNRFLLSSSGREMIAMAMPIFWGSLLNCSDQQLKGRFPYLVMFLLGSLKFSNCYSVENWF